MKFLEKDELSNYTFQNDFMRPFVVVMRQSQVGGLLFEAVAATTALWHLGSVWRQPSGSLWVLTQPPPSCFPQKRFLNSLSVASLSRAQLHMYM